MAFVVALPLVFVLRFVQARLLVAYDRARHGNGQMLGTIAEVVSGAPTIRAYGAGPTMATDVSEAVARFDGRPFERLRNAAELMPGNASRVYLELERE